VAYIHNFGSLFINIGKPQKPNDLILLHNKKGVMAIRDEQMEAFGHGICHADGLPLGGVLDEVFYLDLFGLAAKLLEWVFLR
jgi:hypothetical protein